MADTEEKKTEDKGGTGFLWGLGLGIVGTFVGGYLLELALEARRKRAALVAVDDGTFGEGWR